jgi:uncharacterized protein (TIGR03032 family)
MLKYKIYSLFFTRTKSEKYNSMAQALPPFSCTYSPGLPELLQQLNCSVAITTYQAGKVIFISPKDRDHLVQLPRQFVKPMGIALSNNTLALATLNEVLILQNNTELAKTYPKQPDTYDGLFIPRTTHYTGELDLHDLQFTTQGLLAVNTRFSCLAYVGQSFNFTPVWKPPFIESLTPDDCCHLNGLACKDDKPYLVTALGKTSSRAGWREKKASGGILMNVQTDEIILKNLAMPHSPRVFHDGIYMLLSASGELVKVEEGQRRYTVVKELDGFARGMDRIGDYLFIGLSKLRQTSHAFRDLPIAKRSVFCGVVVVHAPTGSLMHYIKYENSVEEIYDVRILPGMIRPGILNHEKPEFRLALDIPGRTFWAKPSE